MTRRSRRLSLFVVLTVAIAVLASCTKNAESWESSVLINTERSNRGTHELVLDPVLIEKAQAWAEWMAATGTVSHSNLRQDTGPGWRFLGENVGWARSVGEMHSLFMASASHRNTILDGRYTKYGTGVAVVNGRYYVAQVFGG